MQLDLKNFSAVVTGGSSGIGLETARLLLAAGARVAICGRGQDRLAKAAESLRDVAGEDRLLDARCNVLDSAEVDEFAALVKERFQGLDMLINNAGQGRTSTFADTSDDAWREELDLKFFSLIYPTRAFLPLLEKSSNAAIVCVNSLLARQPESHMVATSAARAGSLNLAHSMAVEFAAKGIRVNSVLIGLIYSGQWGRRFEAAATDGQSWEEWSADLAAKREIPLGRIGDPAEAARAIVFLASPWASYITGTTVDVAGGMARHV